VKRYKPNLKLIKRAIIWIALVVIPITLLSIAAYLTEGKDSGSHVSNYFDALWMTVVTMLTVGFGDVIPVTAAGRVVSVVAMVTGVLTIAGITANLATYLLERVIRSLNVRRIEKMQDHVIILGWNENALRIIQVLQTECSDDNVQIIVLADLEQRPLELQSDINFVTGDPSKIENLEKIFAPKARTAVLLANFETNPRATDSRTILTTFAVKKVSKGRCRVVAEVLMSEDLEYLKLAGVDEVVVRSDVSADLLTRAVSTPGVVTLIEQLISLDQPGSIGRIEVPKKYIGKDFGDFFIGVYYESTVIPIAILRDGQTILNPAPQETLLEHDEAFIISPSFGQCKLKIRR
jgi:voltage-gated potassium channel